MAYAIGEQIPATTACKPVPSRRTRLAAVLVGFLILAAAGGEFYGAWRVRRYVGRMELSRLMAVVFFTPPTPYGQNGSYNGRGSNGPNSSGGPGSAGATPATRGQNVFNFSWMAISLTTQYAWLAASWVAAGLLGLAGLWMVLRARFAWRLIWVGAVAVIVAGAATMIAAYVLVHYADYHPLSKRLYATAFLVHSLPGWLLLAAWLFMRLHGRAVRRRPLPAGGP